MGVDSCLLKTLCWRCVLTSETSSSWCLWQWRNLIKLVKLVENVVSSVTRVLHNHINMLLLLYNIKTSSSWCHWRCAKLVKLLKNVVSLVTCINMRWYLCNITFTLYFRMKGIIIYMTDWTRLGCQPYTLDQDLLPAKSERFNRIRQRREKKRNADDATSPPAKKRMNLKEDPSSRKKVDANVLSEKIWLQCWSKTRLFRAVRIHVERVIGRRLRKFLIF